MVVRQTNSNNNNFRCKLSIPLQVFLATLFFLCKLTSRIVCHLYCAPYALRVQGFGVLRVEALFMRKRWKISLLNWIGGPWIEVTENFSCIGWLQFCQIKKWVAFFSSAMKSAVCAKGVLWEHRWESWTHHDRDGACSEWGPTCKEDSSEGSFSRALEGH